MSADDFGPIRAVPLSRLQIITARHLSASAQQIPHVTHHDQIDVTDAEILRKAASEKMSLLSLLMVAATRTLRDHPMFNATLDIDGARILHKAYVNMGVAIDTPRGLVVGVVKAADRLSVGEIGAGVDDLAARARGRGLPVEDLMGGSFTISALGRLGGVGFTPIINAPQVAILGVSNLIEVPRRAADDTLEWRRMLPLSLSYDHRAVNGADAGRFMLRLAERMADPAALMRPAP